MPQTSTNLSLKLEQVPEDDGLLTGTYINDQSGYSSVSNMQKIDAFAGETRNEISGLKGVGYTNQTIKGNFDLITSTNSRVTYTAQVTGTNTLVGTIAQITTPLNDSFIKIIPSAYNTSGVTLNINSTGALPIVKVQNWTGSTVYASLEANDLQPNQPVLITKSSDGIRYIYVGLENSANHIYYKKADLTYSTVQSELDNIINTSAPIPITTPFGSTVYNKTSDGSASAEMQITGKHYVNQLGKLGDCESTAPFTASGCTLSLDTSKKVFGANALKITLTATTGTVSIPIGSAFNVAGHALFSAYLDKGNATNITLQKDATGGGVLRSVVSTAVTPTRSCFVTAPSDNHASNLIKIVVTGSIGQIAYIDGIMDNEILASEYALPIASVLGLYPYAEGLAVVTNPSVTITHADGSKTQTVIEGRFFTGENPKLVNGKVIGQKLWREARLLGKDYDWQYNNDYSGFKRFVITNNLFKTLASADASTEIMIKSDEKPLKFLATIDQSDTFAVDVGNGILYTSAPDTDTGFAESINPNADEVKAFMNGWKATANNGTRYTAWVSVVDGTTVPTAQSIDFVKANVAPNYDGYRLAYKLATAEPSAVGEMSAVDARLKGDLPIIEKGNNTIVIDNGLVLGELANPTTSGAYTAINNSYEYNVANSYADNRLRNKTESIKTVYKNNAYDNVFMSGLDSTNANGKVRTFALATSVESSATYTVDYKILATQAPNIGTVALSYNTGLLEAVADLQEQVNNRQIADPALDRVVSLADYEVFTQINGQGICNKDPLGQPRFGMWLGFTPKNSPTPTVYPTLGSLPQYYRASTGAINQIPNSDMTVLVATVTQRGCFLYWTYVGTDATIKSNLLAYGFVGNATVAIDARKGV